jgi:isoprenylcysteine carboxyl methyltransferase (ICMT) family protein YpbQ
LTSAFLIGRNVSGPFGMNGNGIFLISVHFFYVFMMLKIISADIFHNLLGNVLMFLFYMLSNVTVRFDKSWATSIYIHF